MGLCNFIPKQGTLQVGQALSAGRWQEGALTLQLFRLFCDVMIKAPVLEGVLAPVFPHLIQVHLGLRRDGLACVAGAATDLLFKQTVIAIVALPLVLAK